MEKVNYEELFLSGGDTAKLIIELSNISKETKTEVYLQTVGMILSNIIVDTDTFDGLAEVRRTTTALRNRVTRKEKVQSKILKDYFTFKNTFMKLYDLMDVYLNMILVNTHSQLSFYETINHIYRHRLIAKDEFNALKVFNSIRNVITHNADEAMANYIKNHPEWLDLIEATSAKANSMITKYRESTLFKGIYITSVTNDGFIAATTKILKDKESFLKTTEGALIDAQKHAGEEPLGANIHKQSSEYLNDK